MSHVGPSGTLESTGAVAAESPKTAATWRFRSESGIATTTGSIDVDSLDGRVDGAGGQVVVDAADDATIGEAFLETAIDGVEYWVQLANVPPQDGTYTTGEEIASYGNSVIERIEQWWTRLEDKSCQQKVKTFYGTPPMHQLFERSTWHSAQHTRQMIAVLERFGIEPDVRLTT